MNFHFIQEYICNSIESYSDTEVRVSRVFHGYVMVTEDGRGRTKVGSRGGGGGGGGGGGVANTEEHNLHHAIILGMVHRS